MPAGCVSSAAEQQHVIARRTAANRRAKLPPILLRGPWIAPVSYRPLARLACGWWRRSTVMQPRAGRRRTVRFFMGAPSGAVLHAASSVWPRARSSAIRSRCCSRTGQASQKCGIHPCGSDFQSCGIARRCQASHCCTWDCCCSHAADATRTPGRRRAAAASSALPAKAAGTLVTLELNVARAPSALLCASKSCRKTRRSRRNIFSRSAGARCGRDALIVMSPACSAAASSERRSASVWTSRAST